MRQASSRPRRSRRPRFAAARRPVWVALIAIFALTVACPLTAWSQAAEGSASSSGDATTEPSADEPAKAAPPPEDVSANDPLVNEPSPNQPKRRKRQYSTGAKAYDVVVLRPWDFLGLIVSSAAFVPAAVLTAPNGRYEVETAMDLMVIEPSENVFQRPLGDF